MTKLAIDSTGIELSLEEISRYSRHLILPKVGIEGQRRLKAASVLLIGAGGLGSPVALYLAAAGVGRIGLVDYDTVAFSNLQRQVIHGSKDVGRSKIESAAEKIRDINPFVQLDLYETPLSSANALEILAPYDLIIDGSDNFPTRYLSNDAAVLLGKPNIYGSIFRFEGQASVFYGAEGPCYRCLFPEPPPPGLVPNCAEGGVLGVLPGIIGTIQATEAIKLITGIGTSLIGRLLIYDAQEMSFDEIQLQKNPKCVLCGENPTVTELIDYEQFCGMPAHDRTEFDQESGRSVMQIVPITPTELAGALREGEELFILDVRQQVEWDIVNLSHLGSVFITQGEVLERLDQLPRDKDIVVHCRSGVRSAMVIQQLQAVGFTRLRNLEGGINRWAREVDSSLPTY